MPRKKESTDIDFKVGIFVDQKSTKLNNVVKKEVENGRKVLYISRRIDSEIDERFGPMRKIMEIHRISPRPENGNIPQFSDSALYNTVEDFLNRNNNTLITILNFEIFSKWLKFDSAFAMLQKILELTKGHSDCAVILFIDPSYYTEEQFESIKGLADKIFLPKKEIKVGSNLDKIDTPFMKTYFSALKQMRSGSKVIRLPVTNEEAELLMKKYGNKNTVIPKSKKKVKTEVKKEEEEEPNPYESEELASLPWNEDLMRK